MALNRGSSERDYTKLALRFFDVFMLKKACVRVENTTGRRAVSGYSVDGFKRGSSDQRELLTRL